MCDPQEQTYDHTALIVTPLLHNTQGQLLCEKTYTPQSLKNLKTFITTDNHYELKVDQLTSEVTVGKVDPYGIYLYNNLDIKIGFFAGRSTEFTIETSSFDPRSKDGKCWLK